MLSASTSLTALLFAWLAYFALHSALASLTAKHWVAARWPALMPAYRLAFNTIAAVALLPIVWLLFSQPGRLVWSWTGAWAWLANGIALAAVGGFLHTLRDYDTEEFLGLRQWRSRTRTVADQEGFHLSSVHRYVRHPWYFFSLLILWTRDMSEAMLLSALVMTIYFVVGARLEERKLIAYHGERYRRYMARVAGLLPLPWKTLSEAQARELVASRD